MSILERELADLRTQRVGLRKAIENAFWSIGDFVERGQMVRHWQNSLRGTERRYEELYALLGKRLPGPAVSLKITPEEQRAVARRNAATALHRRGIDRRGYLTKDMVAGDR